MSRSAALSMAASIASPMAWSGRTLWGTAHPPTCVAAGMRNGSAPDEMMGGTVGVGVACLRTVVNRVNPL